MHADVKLDLIWYGLYILIDWEMEFELSLI